MHSIHIRTPGWGSVLATESKVKTDIGSNWLGLGCPESCAQGQAGAACQQCRMPECLASLKCQHVIMTACGPMDTREGSPLPLPYALYFTSLISKHEGGDFSGKVLRRTSEVIYYVYGEANGYAGFSTAGLCAINNHSIKSDACLHFVSCIS